MKKKMLMGLMAIITLMVLLSIVKGMTTGELTGTRIKAVRDAALDKVEEKAINFIKER